MSSDPSKEDSKAKKALDSFVSKSKQVGEALKEKGKEFDEKHGQKIKDGAKQAASTVVEKTKEVAEKLKPKPKDGAK